MSTEAEPAAGGSGVHILVLPVIQQQAAVLELGAHVHTVPLEEVLTMAWPSSPRSPVRIRSKSAGLYPVSRKKAERVS